LFQTPSFPSVILESHNLDLRASPSLADVGLCTTLNGNSIEDTYENSNSKMKSFKSLLGSASKIPFRPMNISGSGNIHLKKMWLNVRDVSNKKRAKGMMSVAINDWKDYMSVR
jgi:hypothetical protein